MSGTPASAGGPALGLNDWFTSCTAGGPTSVYSERAEAREGHGPEITSDSDFAIEASRAYARSRHSEAVVPVFHAEPL